MLERHAAHERLLLVGDDPVAAEALSAHLTRHGFLVVGRVRTADAARTAARYTAPDVVLVDSAVHDGWRNVVDALDGVLEHGRIAVLASYWDADTHRDATATGVGAVILKAMQGASLAGRLREIAAHA
jgi:DNA-binding NarL/FixJ family response regulator